MTDRHLIPLFGALLWFGAVSWLAAHGAFVSGPDEPPIALAVAFVTPILSFLLSVRLFPGWRVLVVSISPVFLIAMNGWRFIGLGFLIPCFFVPLIAMAHITLLEQRRSR